MTRSVSEDNLQDALFRNPAFPEYLLLTFLI